MGPGVGRAAAGCGNRPGRDSPGWTLARGMSEKAYRASLCKPNHFSPCGRVFRRSVSESAAACSGVIRRLQVGPGPPSPEAWVAPSTSGFEFLSVPLCNSPPA